MASPNIIDLMAPGITRDGQSGGIVAKGSNNPYSLFYTNAVGNIFGRPLAFNPRADPNQRVFQKTMIRNNTIINIIPGMASHNKEMLEEGEKILKDFNEKYEKELAASKRKGGHSTKLAELSQDAMDQLIAKGIDLRFAAFKPDMTGFVNAFQITMNRVGTAVFSLGKQQEGIIFQSLKASRNGSSMNTGGFKLWVEKGTSVSDSVDNGFQQSVLAAAAKGASGMVKQLKFLGMSITDDTMAANSSDTAEVTASDSTAATTGMLSQIVSKSASGTSFDFPQMFDESKFNRSYDISFRFTSPYGDDNSIYNYVLIPFLAILTLALPHQDGPNGHASPFLVQLDAPGFFSCPMGVITSLSFKKGGDDMLFNDRGLPLIIEGSFSVMDLYSNLSLPMSYGQFATNYGASAFFNNLGGLTIYNTNDTTVSRWLSEKIKNLIRPIGNVTTTVREKIYDYARFFGVTGALQSESN